MEYITENWWYLLLVAGFGYMMLKGGGCCGGGHSHGGHNHNGHNGHNGQHGSNQVNNKIDMVIDPECGMYINPETAIKQNIDGNTYYFCSENCRSSFLNKQQKI
ncbi:MAG: hypothetical protein A2Y23_04160 [Clostridiales bacterium GWB2_37_7]|nr:MAG: hypothetical protein A2Y23_04160 [Clostridiales bacterium GWB2_37_7]